MVLFKGFKMAAITLKNIPDSLYRQIKKSAKDNFRSMNNEMLFRLKLALEAKSINPEKLISRIEKFQKRLVMKELTDELLSTAKNEGRP